METALRARDGTPLAATVWRTTNDESQRPAVVIRTPYGRRRFTTAPWTRIVDADYALVAVDVRGRGDSEGNWRPWVRDGHDGYDVVEWVAEQPWCNGAVGTIGGSYDAMTQWWAAATQPPHLRCMIPMAVSPQLQTPAPRGRSNGVVMPYWLWWLHFLDAPPGAPDVDWAAVLDADDRAMARVAGVPQQPWLDYLAGRTGYGEASWAVDPAQVRTPALVTNGWWDDPETFSWWSELQHSPAAADHRLLVGPWDHAGNVIPRPTLGGVDVSSARIDPVEHWLRFLDHWLGDADTDAAPRATVCRSGTWRWESLANWPQVGDHTTYELGSGSWWHDPTDPLWLGGGSALAFADAPLDPAAYDTRADVLTLDLPADETVQATGEPVLDLTVTQEHPGTLVAWLSDIAPSGRGIRFGVWPTAAHHPGGRVALTTRLAALHHELLPGHHYRVSLASSFAPIYAHAHERQRIEVKAATLHLAQG